MRGEPSIKNIISEVNVLGITQKPHKSFFNEISVINNVFLSIRFYLSLLNFKRTFRIIFLNILLSLIESNYYPIELEFPSLFCKKALLIFFVFLYLDFQCSQVYKSCSNPQNECVSDTTFTSLSLFQEKSLLAPSISLQIYFWNFIPIYGGWGIPMRSDLIRMTLPLQKGYQPFIQQASAIFSQNPLLFFGFILGQPKYLLMEFVGFIRRMSTISCLIASLIYLNNFIFDLWQFTSCPEFAILVRNVSGLPCHCGAHASFLAKVTHRWEELSSYLFIYLFQFLCFKIIL